MKCLANYGPFKDGREYKVKENGEDYIALHHGYPYNIFYWVFRDKRK